MHFLKKMTKKIFTPQLESKSKKRQDFEQIIFSLKSFFFFPPQVLQILFAGILGGNLVQSSNLMKSSTKVPLYSSIEFFASFSLYLKLHHRKAKKATSDTCYMFSLQTNFVVRSSFKCTMKDPWVSEH